MRSANSIGSADLAVEDSAASDRPSRISARVYLAGPMTGLPQYNAPAFNAAALLLRSAGYTVFNPAENIDAPIKPTSHYMRVDIDELVNRTDFVVILDGWYASRGANTEVLVAWQCGIPVRRISGLDADGNVSLEALDITPLRLPYALDEPSDDPILVEAQRIIHGARRSSYGHPFDEYACVAAMMSSLIRDKLRGDVDLSPEEAAMFMILVKLRRERFRARRDNRVDGAGYWGVLDLINEEGIRRAQIRAAAEVNKGLMKG